LLRLRPAQRVYWIGLAISYHLLGRHQEAIKVISVYEQTAKDRSEGSVDYEHSELLMYKNDLMTEAGDYENAYKQLVEVDTEVCDRKAYNFRKAELLVKLKRYEEAEKEYEFLLSDNAENYEILNGYLQALCLVEEGTNKPKDSEKIVQAIDKLRKVYPKSRMLQRMGLHYSEGKKFRDAAAEFLMSSSRKGVPSLFVSIKAMLQNPEKMEIISDLAFSFQDSLKKYSKFTKESENDESPSTFLWVTFFLAQLKDLQGEHQAALDLINESIDHTPTLLELHMFKGRIFKHAGNSEYAAFVMDEARKLDLQDRFINCKSSKYYLRNDDINTAEKLMGLFTKQGDWEEKMYDLVEMQCLWFAIEVGQSYARASQYGMALKKFEQVFKTFDDIEDDQFDFHTYSLRKMTIRSYISLLKMEDNLRSQKFFVKAAEGAIRIYLKLHDEPSLKEAKSVDPELEGMSENEKKKHLSKQKKQQAKELAAKESNPKGEKEDKKKKDDDPAGLKHLKTSQPLEEAKRFLVHLQRQCPSLLITHELTFEIAFREKAYFVAYKALCLARKYHANSSLVHSMTVRLWNVFVNEKPILNERLLEIVKEVEPTKFGSTNEIVEYNLKHIEKSISEKKVDHIIQGMFYCFYDTNIE
jgi:peptide alpha-N-acetyltransferase